MKLEQSFDVPAPVETVWELLNDLERVAPCLPGAAITERDEDGAYHGTFDVKLGPTSASYRGVIAIKEADVSARTSTLTARGQDKRGQGGANATIVNRLVETPEGTRVQATTDLTITGQLARFGRPGMIEGVADRLLREFATCLATQAQRAQVPEGAEAQAPPAPQARPISGIRLMLGVLWDRIRRLFGRE
ncbi:MAG TPA: SRPBCC family protein [Solirubrobacteraceae bacterium]|nr:SRPBCC family protein [Solirubrobacteraceae bacterium]